MPSTTRLAVAGAGFAAAALLAMPRAGLLAQTQAPAPSAVQSPSVPLPATPPGPPAPTPAQIAAQEAAAADRKDMMDKLGIKALRPGPSGNEQAPNHANYDEAHGQSRIRTCPTC